MLLYLNHHVSFDASHTLVVKITFTLKDIPIFSQHKHTLALRFVTLSDQGIFPQNSAYQ